MNIPSNNLRSQLLSVVFILVLCIHFIAYRFITIYPSLVFPAFSGAPNLTNEASIILVDLYGISDAGDSIKIEKKVFLHNLYYKHVNYILDHVAKNERAFKGNSRLERERKEFLAFSKESLFSMYPSKSFKSLIIERSERKYDTKHNMLKDLTIIVDKVTIPLYDTTLASH